jgi:hypothetical protein
MLLSASPDRSAILRRVIGLFIVRSNVTQQAQACVKPQPPASRIVDGDRHLKIFFSGSAAVFCSRTVCSVVFDHVVNRQDH